MLYVVGESDSLDHIIIRVSFKIVDTLCHKLEVYLNATDKVANHKELHAFLAALDVNITRLSSIQ